MAEVLAKDRHALKGCFLLGCLPGLSAMETYRNIRETLVSFRPRLDIDDDISDVLEDEPRSSVREVSSHTGPSFATIFRHQKESGRTAEYGQVISHELTDSQLKLSCDLSQSLLSRKRNFDWILDIVTGNEKWSLYVYHTGVLDDDEPLTDQKREMHEKKVMLSVWWDRNGVICYKLLPDRATITVNLYCQQLREMIQFHRSLRPEIDHSVLLHYNARSHSATESRNFLQAQGVKVLPHPPYSSDLPPTEYHLFKSLQNSFAGQKFDDRMQVKSYLDDFFTSQPAEFYAAGIAQLPQCWQDVTSTQGQYITY
ncbi:hypothetical protein CRE_14421 [Caenorhabditis remanei]|uniref:Mos1 transposase HTH domain-containing protein n=1 Tax=Caenorhabditis remanei TaxID=31234 RepID=E3NRR7_CAERE|nr:hypothetical protein CRE_14421 [Caenorhabditis remanei]